MLLNQGLEPFYIENLDLTTFLPIRGSFWKIDRSNEEKPRGTNRNFAACLGYPQPSDRNLIKSSVFANYLFLKTILWQETHNYVAIPSKPFYTKESI